MKVETIKQNYSAQRLPLNSRNSGGTPNFTGMNINKEIMEQLPNKTAIKVMEKFKWLKGELGGILITALGTGAVAPIFIAYNPFVKAPKDATKEQKEDVENTKKYTAMRQPVSAVLAVLIQTSILKPIDKGLEILFNNPKYAKNLWISLDQSTLSKQSYVEKQVKKEMKKEGLKFENKEAFKQELDKRVNEKLKMQIGQTAENLRQTGKIQIGERIVENKTTAEIVNDTIDSYIEDAKNLKTSDEGLKFYKQRAQILVENEDVFKELFKELPESGNEIAEKLKKASLNTDNQDVKTILEEIINAPENLRASRCQRTLERIETVRKACNGNFTPENYLKAMQATNKELDKIIANLEASKIKDVNSATENTIKSTINKVAEFCHYDNTNFRLDKKFQETATFQTNVEDLMKKIYKDITKGYKKVIEKRYKGFNQISKIAIGLCITLPITCTALNWVYPRFMDLCFPKLSGKKKDDAQKVKNGGDD